ncbi:MAG: sigma-70 family RNA polymerase sigma factor [Pseudomonadota bacterium]|uniref:sigma-70 family RNA polymerase sigma factor n=1 Tax=Methylophaga aminisulfidivorans TaxID=230105 RepID=UPI0024E25982|nr:sigma-70 family RNA polymerase sigma factor [Methylophaga aminisulfidivorans]MEC9413924.1 sigma-70 family RNA polymerase sigma factor [Pseudomonadota bacterium]
MAVQTLESLYSEHHHWLQNWIRSRLNNVEQAQDLTQETFIKVLMKGREHEFNSPKAYLSSIARGLLVDFFRRRTVEQAYLDALEVQPEQHSISAEQHHLIIDTLLQIEHMLDTMSERGRQIFLLAQLDGLTFAEIGRQLNVSVTTVRKHFIRAMTQCLLLIED